MSYWMYNTHGDLCGEIRKVIDGVATYLLFNSNRVEQTALFDDLNKTYKLVVRTV